MKYSVNGTIVSLESSPVSLESILDTSEIDKAFKEANKAIEAYNLVSNVKAMESFGYKATEGLGESIKNGAKAVWEKIKAIIRFLREKIKLFWNFITKSKSKLNINVIKIEDKTLPPLLLEYKPKLELEYKPQSDLYTHGEVNEANTGLYEFLYYYFEENDFRGALAEGMWRYVCYNGFSNPDASEKVVYKGKIANVPVGNFSKLEFAKHYLMKETEHVNSIFQKEKTLLQRICSISDISEMLQIYNDSINSGGEPIYKKITTDKYAYFASDFNNNSYFSGKDHNVGVKKMRDFIEFVTDKMSVSDLDKYSKLVVIIDENLNLIEKICDKLGAHVRGTAFGQDSKALNDMYVHFMNVLTDYSKVLNFVEGSGSVLIKCIGYLNDLENRVKALLLRYKNENNYK